MIFENEKPNYERINKELCNKRFKEFSTFSSNLTGVVSITYDSLITELEIVYQNGIVDIIPCDKFIVKEREGK